jgi:hypothetical protein
MGFCTNFKGAIVCRELWDAAEEVKGKFLVQTFAFLPPPFLKEKLPKPSIACKIRYPVRLKNDEGVRWRADRPDCVPDGVTSAGS